MRDARLVLSGQAGKCEEAGGGMKRLLACLALAVFSLSPPFGQAADRCPDAADVDDRGVVVDFSDGSRVVYSLASDDRKILELNLLPDPAGNFWVESWLGVYPLADGRVSGGAPVRSYYAESVYPVALDTLPAPTTGASWAGVLKEVDSRGRTLGETRLTVKFGGLRPLVIGECAYQALQVETLFSDADGGFQGTLDYLPELGISIQTAGGDLGSLLDFYLPVSISVAADTGAAGD